MLHGIGLPLIKLQPKASKCQTSRRSWVSGTQDLGLIGKERRKFASISGSLRSTRTPTPLGSEWRLRLSACYQSAANLLTVSIHCVKDLGTENPRGWPATTQSHPNSCTAARLKNSLWLHQSQKPMEKYTLSATLALTLTFQTSSCLASRPPSLLPPDLSA